MDKFYVTMAIPYVNDRPHIGHLLLAAVADITARYKKQEGYEVFFSTGTDEHGLKIKQSAQKAGKNPKEFADQVSAEFKKAWQLLKIDYSYFIRTTDTKHKKLAQEFLQKLYDSGYIYKGTYEGLYCVGCEKFLTDSDLNELGCCLFHKPEQTIKQKEENYFFKLSEFAPKVCRLIKNDKFKVIPNERKKEILSRIEYGVEDISISREKLDWGVSIPWDKTQTTYVWVEALLNYWTIPYIVGKENLWPPDAQIIGKDILWFHAVIWPAMLVAAGENLPEELFVHSFLTLEGKKMSKSLGNVIGPNELVDRYGVDATRYLLAKLLPYSNDKNAGFSKFDKLYNADLANGWGNTIARVTALCEKNNAVLDEIYENTPEANLLSETSKRYHKYMNAYQFHLALDVLWDEIRKLDIDIDKDKPWNQPEEISGRMLKSYLKRIKKINNLLRPFMPETSEKVSKEISSRKKIKKLSLFPRIVSYSKK